MLETLRDKQAQWLAGDGPEASRVIVCRGELFRNLADFPFPSRCASEEKRAIVERVLGALEGSGLLRSGRYCPAADLDSCEARVLAERQLLSRDFTDADGSAGVYLINDQSLSIAVNDEDHVHIRVLASGLGPEEVWSRLNGVDDALAQHLDFAWDERLGYLMSSLERVGTGFKLAVMLHLPALTMIRKIVAMEQRLRTERHLLRGVYGDLTEARGDLYEVSNQSTLGRSEMEIVYHLKHTVQNILAEEKGALDSLTPTAPGLRNIEDRVGRAFGISRGARLLDFAEAVGLLSSLRLGVVTGILEGFPVQQFNELLMACQHGHLEMRRGGACDEVTLGMERADLFRASFS
jgi:protein arginine kinase